MLVLDQDKSYSFSNMTVKITDNYSRPGWYDQLSGAVLSW